MHKSYFVMGYDNTKTRNNSVPRHSIFRFSFNLIIAVQYNDDQNYQKLTKL